MKLLSVLLSTCLAASPVLAERTFGLVIGIDDYTYIPDLQGAVNDAQDIATTLSGMGADVTLLVNEHATRDAILGAWNDIIEVAEPGDRLIVSYAGHGSNEPEHTPGNEADGRDENFLLAGFAPRGAAAAERLRDDEIADLIDAAPELEVIIVADACHSGTVTRNLNPVLGYRYVAPTGIQSDPLPPPPPRRVASDGQNDVALFLAAVNEAEKVPEFLIDGQPRGALSYAFARGLRGEADSDGDAVVTKGELESYVRRTVRDISDGVQLPQSHPVGLGEKRLFEIVDTGTTTVQHTTEFAQLRDVSVLNMSDLPLPSGAVSAGQGLPELTINPSGTVISMIGDTVANAGYAAALNGIVQKHRAMSGLAALTDPQLDVRFQDGDRTYLNGSPVTIQITGRQTDALSLISVNPLGEITFLYPISGSGFSDPLTLPPDQSAELSLQIAAPFGADHVIAVESSNSPAALRTALARLDGTQDMAQLWSTLVQDHQRLTVFPFFSEAGE